MKIVAEVDPWDAWGQEPKSTVTALPLAIQPARLPAPATIPPREWLYGTSIIRRFVTVLVAPGGTGKSLYGMGVAMALASGKPILGERVHHRVNAWVMNLEDPLDELDRRVAAMMLRHRLRPEDLAGRLFLHSGRDRRLTMASRTDDGYAVQFPDKDAVIAAARAAQIGLIVVDPFVKSHQLEENSNPDMDAAATAWAEVGDATGAGIKLIHHTRKGAVADIDAARGGKALTDAARVGLTMAPMTEEEADSLGIPAGERWRHVRLDDQKVNMSPRGEKAQWFRLETQSLNNATPDYPNGDHVAAIAPWTPPTVWRDTTPEQLNAVLDAIAAGTPTGLGYAPSRRGRGNARWVGGVLMDMLGVEEDQANRQVAAWLREGVLSITTERDPDTRKDVQSVRVVHAKRPTV